jgi:DnaJ-class molecular chaperone
MNAADEEILSAYNQIASSFYPDVSTNTDAVAEESAAKF